MPALLPDIDPDGLLEFSVVYTDHSLNHMSDKFIAGMQDVISTLREVYQAYSVALVPGGGTYGMEAVARQLAADANVLIVRNGLFSYRWSQILEMAKLTDKITVCKAWRTQDGLTAPWQPVAIEELERKIASVKPEIVFAPHVETSSGIMLPDDYISRVASAVHAVGGLLVLDCIASGAVWVDMQKTGVDVLISAPQKGWSGSPGFAMVCLNERAQHAVQASNSNSFAMDLKKWLEISQGYVKGKHAYHATMPTDTIMMLRNIMQQGRAEGFEKLAQRQKQLGSKVRQLLVQNNYPSVADKGFEAAGVVVSYTTDKAIQSGALFKDYGVQIASGVPLACDEPDNFQTFRIGLFGLEKLRNVERTVQHIQQVLEKISAR